MQRLIDGLQHYMKTVHAQERELFNALAKGQQPDTCFVTCSDSRVEPSLIMQTSPGDVFVLRNAGNIIPPYGAPQGGEAATLEYAASVLNVAHIIVCGHSDCGAMRGLLSANGALDNLPEVKRWLQYAECTRRIVDERPELTGEARVRAAIEINVLCQLSNLRTHPAIAARMALGKLELHGWVYEIGTGQVRAFDSGLGLFKPLLDQPTPLTGLPEDLRQILSHDHYHAAE